MSEERYSYVHNRVLIDSARVLSAQFDDTVIYVTGAQLELLRNVTQYLNRLTTYATETHPGYYLTPDAADFDDILEIVADLEETLMGNPNTIWGYKERWVAKILEYGVGTADVWCTMPAVPDGEIWVLEEAYVVHGAAASKDTRMYADADGVDFFFFWYPSAPPFLFHRWQGSLAMSYGDIVAAHVVAPGDGKSVQFLVWGHKMVVPEA